MQSVFVEREINLIASVLDRIIPPHEKLPGAGELGVTDHIASVVGLSVGLRRLFVRGLTEIGMASHRRYSKQFTDLTDGEKDAVLRGVEADEPDFFDALVQHTYNGYYTNRKTFGLLGLEAHPPQPGGYSLEAGNLALIENVKKRGRAYRGSVSH